MTQSYAKRFQVLGLLFFKRIPELRCLHLKATSIERVRALVKVPSQAEGLQTNSLKILKIVTAET